MANTVPNPQSLVQISVSSTAITVSSGTPPHNLASDVPLVPSGLGDPGSSTTTWKFFWQSEANRTFLPDQIVNGLNPTDPVSFTYGSLTPNTTYTLDLIIQDAFEIANSLPGHFTPDLSITTLPAVSLGSLTVNSVGSTVVSISHPAASNGTPNFTFQWYRNAGSGAFTPGGGNILGGQTGITLNDTGLTPGAVYSYICVVTDGAGYTANSPQLSLTTNASLALGTPTSVSVGSTISTISSAAATGGSPTYSYHWYRATSGSGFTPGPTNILAGQTFLTLNDSALTPATNYWYKLVVTDSVSATATSSARAITTASALTISTPTLTSVTSSTAIVTSSGGSGGTGGFAYQWYRSTTSGFVPSLANVLVGRNSLTLNDVGLTPLTTYFYVLGVSDSAGDTTFSAQLSVSTSAAPLSIGSITVNAVGQTAITLSAPTAVGGAPAYTYSWSRSLVQGTIGTALSFTTQTITDTGLTPNTEYFYTCTVTDSASPTPVTANSPQVGVTTTAVSTLGSYYADLLILQYVGMPNAYAMIKAISDMATLPATSTQTADDILPLVIQNAFNLNSASGSQLDIIAKYVGVSRNTSNLTGSPLILSDVDFLALIKIGIATSLSGSSLATIVALLFQFFPGEVFVTDNQNFSLSYLINSSVGSQNLIDAFISEQLLPRPMGVQISSVIVNPSLNFFGFSSYGPGGTWIPAAPAVQGFNTYASYNMNSPWMDYSMAVKTGI